MKTITIKRRIAAPSWWQKIFFWTLYKKFEISIPTAWADVEEHHFIEFFEAAMSDDFGERTLNCVKVLLPNEIRKEVHLIAPSSIVRISKLLAFLEPQQQGVYEQEKLLCSLHSYEVKISTSLNVFVFAKTTGILPGANLENLKCRDFRDAIQALSKFEAGDAGARWDILAALLQRSKKSNGKYFKTDFLEKHLKFPVVDIILKYFLDSISEMFFTVSQISPDFFNNSNKSMGEETANFGWDGLFMEVAKDGVFGTYKDVLNTKFEEVLFYSIKKFEDAKTLQKAAYEE